MRKIVGVEFDNNSWTATYIDDLIEWRIVNPDKLDEVVPFALIDGYGIGDRVLEDVMFKIEPLAGKNGFTVKSHESHFNYLNTLNMNMWMEKLAQHVAEADELSDGKYADAYMWSHILDEENGNWADDDLMNAFNDSATVPVKPSIQELLDAAILAALKSMAEQPVDPVNDLNRDVMGVLKVVSDAEKIETLARLLAQGDRLYYLGEDKELTQEEFNNLESPDKYRWMARYVLNTTEKKNEV